MIIDPGDNPYVYEMGTNLTLSPFAPGITTVDNGNGTWTSTIRPPPRYSKDTYVFHMWNREAEAVNYEGAGVLSVGKSDDWNWSRTYIAFDLGFLPAGVSISSAALSIYKYGGFSGYDFANRPVTIKRIAGDWNASTITFENSAEFCAAYSTGPCNPTTPAIDSTIFGTWTNPTDNYIGWANWSATTLVSNWYRNIYPNYGFYLDENYPQTHARKAFYDSTASDALLRPKLVVTYTAPQ